MNPSRWTWAAALGAALLVTACSQLGNAQPSAAARNGDVRVATYNIEWFSEDANPQRIANLKSVIKNLDADVIGLQEIQSKKALEQVFDNNWTLYCIDKPEFSQELAIAVRKPFVLQSTEFLFNAPALEEAFPNDRDVLKATIGTPNGKTLTVMVVHMKSRRGGRLQTDFQREMANAMIAGYIMGQANKNIVVLGDFNDSPGDRSLNILETGDLMVKGGPLTKEQQRLMVNLTEPLAVKDYVTFGLNDKFTGQDIQPVVEGAFADNERLRGQNYQFPQDVKVTQIMFDQILVSRELFGAFKGTVGVYSGADALRGQGGRTQVENNVPNYTVKGDLASDHLPVFADLTLP